MQYFDFWPLALIALLPGFGALFNGIFGRRLPTKVVHTIACGTIGVSFILSILATKVLVEKRALMDVGDTALVHHLYNFLSFGPGNLNVDITFYFDALTAVMCLVITGVGFLIHLYSIGYMKGDESYSRYFTYLNLFCFAMLLLVLGQNLVLLFVGWEGVGLASYLLIGFWFTDEAKAKAGKKAFIVNRIGDFAFLGGVLMLFTFVGTLDIPSIELAIASQDTGTMAVFAPYATVIALMFFVGCTGKSAQIPLYIWLPDAMAGPTPVSALIHAATMVTAGVYLIARMNFLFALSPATLTVIAIVGATTALVAATIACVQKDIKKVLAYSTVSQLGFMFLACGVGAYGAAIFHLMTHAFFKGLLFLGAGAVIYALHHEQDITKMGGLRKKLPIVHGTFLVACLAISGVPFFAGFFSKDEILWYALAGHTTSGFMHFLLWATAAVTAGLTAFYMFRLYFLTFGGKYRGDKKVLANLHDPPTSMDVPLFALGILAAIGGFIGLPAVLGDVNVIGNWLAPVLGHPHLSETFMVAGHDGAMHASHAWEWAVMGISVLIAGAGIFVAYKFYIKSPEVPGRIKSRFERVYQVVFDKYYVDEAYGFAIVRPMFATARGLYKVVDRILIDGLLVGGPVWLFQSGGRILRLFQNGNVQRYAFFIVFGLSVTLIVVYLG